MIGRERDTGEGNDAATRTAEEVLGTVGRAMTRNVVTVLADDHLGSAVRDLERAEVNGAPVVRDGRVVGVVSMRELRSVLPRNAVVATTGPFHRWEPFLDQAAGDRRVHEVMDGRGVTVTMETPLREAARVLVEHAMTRVPVVDRDGGAVGILTRQDVVEAVAAR